MASSVMITQGYEMLYIVKGLQVPLPSPYCAVLYGSNPYLNADTTGIVACGNPQHEKQSQFPQSVVEKYGYDLKTFSKGISYVVTGSKCSIKLFDGTECEKDSLNSVTFSGGTKADLTKVPKKMKNRLKSQHHADIITEPFSDATLSFVLSYNI